MDSVTQAALGAALGQATFGRSLGRTGAISGALIATLPDLDVLLYGFFSSLEMLRIHRGLSHSFLFCVICALVLSVVMKRSKWFKAMSYLWLYGFALLCLTTHVLLDFCTAYGTQLLLPFSDTRWGLDTINVVDPVYTLPLLLGVLGPWMIPQWKDKKQFINALGLAISTGYILFTLCVKQNTEKRFASFLDKQEVQYQDILTIPVGYASVHWYGVAVTDSIVYMKQMRAFERLLPPVVKFERNLHLLENTGQEWNETMKWFSKGFYVIQQKQDTTLFFNLQVDMRGIIENDSLRAPTKGYFWTAPEGDGSFSYGSGTLPSF